MGTEVLRPHNCLIERIRVPQATVIPRRRSLYNNNHYNSHLAKPRRSKPAPTPAPARSDQTKNASTTSPAIARRYSSDDLRQSKNSHNHKHNNHRFVIGQVAILRRGERLDLKPRTETETVPKQIWNRCRSLSPKHVGGGMPDKYAGSAISVSPSPESLPLPSFSKRKQEVSVAVDDSATRDLRRLLRLD